VRGRHLDGGEVLFNAGDAGDALYIVARGKVDVLSGGAGSSGNGDVTGEKLAELSEGQAFGEMALLSGQPRTATIQAAGQIGTDLLEIGREDFNQLLLNDHQLTMAVERLSHERAIKNLSSGAANPSPMG
jgi:CRP-like cAMP-binding protein